jgi:hypothetical protein
MKLLRGLHCKGGSLPCCKYQSRVEVNDGAMVTGGMKFGRMKFGGLLG